MAETFEAVRRGPGGFEQRVCIKRILPAFENDKEFVAAFLREATTSAQLRHANIVQVLDFGVEAGCHYLALELIDGMDLRNLAGSVGRLAADLVTLIAIDLASALHHAHVADGPRPSVVHRDISPSNVLISAAGEVKLVDFGIAKALGGTHLTATGVIKGKVPYLPPEYIEHAQFDARSDLFSLGVMLYELLSGTRPFDGESDFDTIRRIVSGQRVPLRALCPETPEALAACVERLIATDAGQRFQSAAALLETLPVISVPAARRRLATLVRPTARMALDAGQAHTLPAASVASRSPAAITRTSVRPSPEPAIPAPSPRAKRVLILALLCAAATLAAAFFARDSLHPQGVAAIAPPLPARPRSPAPATEVVKEAATERVISPEAPTAAPPETSEKSPKSGGSRTSHRSAELRIVAVPFGDVWIDGKAMGHAPVNAHVPPGDHEIAVGDGRPAQRRTIRLGAGDSQNVVFRVAPE